MIGGYAQSAIAIGGSAGSLSVVKTLLAAMSAECADAVMVCLHTASQDTAQLCDVLARGSVLPVIEAGERDPVRAGHVYVAAGGYHLLVEKDRHFALSDDERVNFARPSIDVVFDTAAEVFRSRLTGVLLSGANHDGAAGLRRIQQLGGASLVQSPASAAVAEMPQAALALMRPDFVGTADEIAIRLADGVML